MSYFKILIIIILLTVNNRMRAQWENLGSKLKNSSSIFSICPVNEKVIWAVAQKGNGTLYYEYTRSVDGGVTWNSDTLPLYSDPYYPGHVFALDDKTAWIIMIESQKQAKVKILKTTNGGISWEEQMGEFNKPGYAFAAVHFFNKNEGIGFGSPGTGDATVDSLRIFRTSNGGNNWTLIPKDELPALIENEGVWVYGENRYETKGDTVWFFTRKARIFRTTDKGKTWQAFSTGITSSSGYGRLSSIAFQNNKEGIVLANSPTQVSRTLDAGKTWSKISFPSNSFIGDIEYIPGTKSTYIVSNGLMYKNKDDTSKYFITKDFGKTWDSFAYSPLILCLKFISPIIGYGGGNVYSPDKGGIYKWKGDLSDLIRSKLNNTFKKDKLLTIYPTLIRDNDLIHYSLTKEFANAILKIVSLDGKIVENINLTPSNNDGTLKFLNGKFLSGIYYYSLEVDGEILEVDKIKFLN